MNPLEIENQKLLESRNEWKAKAEGLESENAKLVEHVGRLTRALFGPDAWVDSDPLKGRFF